MESTRTTVETDSTSGTTDGIRMMNLSHGLNADQTPMRSGSGSGPPSASHPGYIRGCFSLLLACGCWLSLAGSVRCEESPIRADALTLDSLLQLALGNNPTVQATIADVNRARGIRWQVTRKPNPFFGYSVSEVGNEGRAGQQGVYFSQEIVTADKLGLNDQVAGWEVEQLNWRWQEQQLRVLGDVRQQFYAVLAARQQREILRQLDAVLARGVEITQQLVDAGELGRGPLLQARLELQQNQLMLRNAQRVVEAAERSLAAAVGLPGLDLGGLTGTLDDVPPDLEFEPTWAFVLAGHPHLEAARAEVARHQWNVQRQRVEPIPNVQTMFQIQQDAITDSVIAGIQVGVELPVHNRNRGMIAAAGAETMRASHEVRRRELALRERFAQAYRRYAVARQQVQTLEEKLLPLARENLNTVQELFALGESSYLDLLTAQRTYNQLNLTLVDARRDLWQAVVLIQSRLMSDALAPL